MSEKGTAAGFVHGVASTIKYIYALSYFTKHIVYYYRISTCILLNLYIKKKHAHLPYQAYLYAYPC